MLAKNVHFFLKISSALQIGFSEKMIMASLQILQILFATPDLLQQIYIEVLYTLVNTKVDQPVQQELDTGYTLHIGQMKKKVKFKKFKMKITVLKKFLKIQQRAVVLIIPVTGKISLYSN